MDEAEKKRIRFLLRDARRIAFLGGAGVSTASGISDFRSKDGLYNIQSNYGVPYETMLSHSYFLKHPDTFYDFYWSTMVNDAAKPNLAHKALADWEAKHHNLTIITQNIDGLHQLAGSKNVLEAHGSIASYHCMDCARRYSLSEIPHHGVPHCCCGGILKPDVVLYEEPLDEETLEKSLAAVSMANVLIIGGTSMTVYPIAGLPQYFTGGHIVLINAEPTPFDRSCDFVIREDIGTVLNELLED